MKVALRLSQSAIEAQRSVDVVRSAFLNQPPPYGRGRDWRTIALLFTVLCFS